MTNQHSHNGGHNAPRDNRLQLFMKGISCQCRDTEIRRAVSIVDGVQDMEIDYAKDAVSIHYSARKTSAEKIRRALQESGFEAHAAIEEKSGRQVSESHDHLASQFLQSQYHMRPLAQTLQVLACLWIWEEQEAT